MSVDQVAIFALTVFVVSIIPGPSMLLALTHGMYYGSRRSLASALGNVSVTFVQSLISVVGLGAILMASETVFQVIKWGGAAYLLYMGVSMIMSSTVSTSSVSGDNAQSNISVFKMFRQSALVTAANPKAIIFFTAVFPQFMNHDCAYFIQSVVLTVVCSLVAFICFMTYVLGGQKLISFLSKTSVSKYFQRAIGGTFVGSGVALALSQK